MNTRTLGTHGLEVSEQGLGCMGMSEFYGRRDEQSAIATLHRSLELGVTFWDTADVYGSGDNERLVARALQGHRDEVVVATKFGNVRGPGGESLGVRGDAEYVREACEASLRRLEVDCIDLYYQHRVDRRVPIEETVGAMAELVAAGKVRHLGLSEAGPETLRRACAVHPIAALQSEYSLFSREVEERMFGVLAELGVGFVAYSPLGRGLLTGRLRRIGDMVEGDARRLRFPRFERENFERNLALVDRLAQLAERKGCTTGQLALAWVLARPERVVPIAGTKKVGRLEENAAASELSLDAGEIAEIEAIFPVGVAAGERYAPQQMGALD